MKKSKIKIDEDKCIGCGACANACHQGAIGMVGGKARMMREDYCDGLGRCLPVCPASAISFEEIETTDKSEVVMEKKEEQDVLPCGCAGTHAKTIERESVTTAEQRECVKESNVSELKQWPVQIKLVPVNAQYFNGAHILVAADCTAYAYADFHKDFIKNKITLVGCPKLDNEDYSKKLAAIIKENDIKSVTVVRMEVPCCTGLEHAVVAALKESGKIHGRAQDAVLPKADYLERPLPQQRIPWQVKVVSTDGNIREN
ncbi:4Fe-4S dicluster domain-containing protein [Parelusimicrobium proximum]|uniref:ATP-binding protein n=1 Tax=Parelusimicrobium proximum TaxID=3228953 RepID=UPI003D17BCDE